jgi:hypothetical protein
VTVRYIRISSIPAGAAPDWVRQRWVGLELPVVLHPQKTGLFASVRRMLTGKGGKDDSFPVATLAAVAILEKSSPDAAQWWRDNAAPIMKPGSFFVFRKDCCYLIEKKAV